MRKEIKEFIFDKLKNYDLPFYVYDTELIRAHCRDFMNIPYENKSINFASMANANREFIKIIKSEGINIFVNSLGHLDIAKSVGYEGKDIIFTSSGMDDRSMLAVYNAGAIVNLDSLGQLERWSELTKGAPAGIRCNIGELVTPKKTRGGYFLGKNSRLGLTIPEIKSLAGNPEIVGLHLYLGTDIVDLDYFEDCYNSITELADLFPNLNYLDFGGGFGVTTPDGKAFDMINYGKYVTELMNKVSEKLGRSVKLILEPGRIIGGEAAWFIVKVTDVKIRENRQLVGVNASSAQFTRPLMYPDDAYHPVLVLSEVKDETPVPGAVYGCSTYSRDFLAPEIELPSLKTGDILAFSHAGSYCASSHIEFLGFDPAEEFFV